MLIAWASIGLITAPMVATAQQNGRIFSNPQMPVAPQAAVPPGDVQFALGNINWALAHPEPCSRLLPCAAWTRTFTVLGYPVAVARLQWSARDMAAAAIACERMGDHQAALIFLTSTQAHDAGMQQWILNHPNAVLQALQVAVPPSSVASSPKELLHLMFPLIIPAI
jgi:hypothetical protein